MLIETKKVIIRTKKFSLTLFKIILLGLFIRILLIAFSLIYDNNAWAIVYRNINAGHGLYEMNGYYYTPLWGYIIGFVSGIRGLVFDVGDTVSSIPELTLYEGVSGLYPAVGMEITFLLGLKIILTVSDLILSVFVYGLVKERTNDEKKSTIAFLLVFLCPVIFGSSSITVMPDTISSLFTVMTIYAIKKERMFSAGICYSIAVWVKFFPIAIAPLLISYLLVLNKNDVRRAALKLITAFGGFFICSLVMFWPQIQKNELINCFDFLHTRLGRLLHFSPEDILLVAVVLYIVFFIVVFCIVRKRMYQSPKPEDMLMEYSLVIVAICMVWDPITQYVVHVIPFLVYCMLVMDARKYRVILIGLSISGLCLVIATNNIVMLNTPVKYNWISAGTAKYMFGFWNCDKVWGVSLIDIINFVFKGVQRIFVGLIPLLFFAKCCHEHFKNNGVKEMSV